MADASALGEVGTTLVARLFETLRDEVTPPLGESNVALASPAALPEDDNVRLSLFLYDVTENSHHKNAHREAVGIDPVTGFDEFSNPPLALDLHYLLTAYSIETAAGTSADTATQHELLGLAMQTLYDAAVLEDVPATNDRTTINLVSAPDDKRMDIWSTFPDTPYQPSVTYVVGPVFVDSRRHETTQRVVEREIGVYVPDAATPDDEGDR